MNLEQVEQIECKCDKWAILLHSPQCNRCVWLWTYNQIIKIEEEIKFEQLRIERHKEYMRELEFKLDKSIG